MKDLKEMNVSKVLTKLERYSFTNGIVENIECINDISGIKNITPEMIIQDVEDYLDRFDAGNYDRTNKNDVNCKAYMKRFLTSYPSFHDIVMSMKEEKNTIKVIVKNVNESLKIVEIKNNLESSQSIVGGYIEIIYIDHSVMMICNETGKVKNLEPNLILKNDIIVGNVFFCNDNNSEDFASLTDSQVEFVTEYIKTRQVK